MSLFRTIPPAISFLFVVCLCLLGAEVVRGADEGVLYEQHLDPYPTKIIIPVEIGDKHESFAFSTLTYSNFLDVTLAGLQLQGGAAGSVLPDFVDGPAISLGSWKLPPQKFGVADLSEINSIGLTHYHGALGSILLQKRVLVLDFEGQSLRISKERPPTTKSLPHTALGRTDFGFAAGIRVPVEGETIQFGLDTGNDGYVGLAHNLFEKFKAAGVIEKSAFRGVSNSPAGGTQNVNWGTFTRGQLLGSSLQGKPVFDSGADSMLGIDFLVNYVLIFDFKEGVLYYQPRHTEPPLMPDAMLGLMLYRREGVGIAAVQPGGAAEAAGLKRGDEIRRLGDLHAAEIDDKAEYEFCLGKAGQTVEVEFRRAGEKEPSVTHLTLPPKVYEFPKGP